MPRKKQRRSREQLLEACLAAFIRAGTMDLSLDTLAEGAGTSKRMLIHYFGGRDALEEMAMSLLEDRLRARFRAGAFPAGTSPQAVIAALWNKPPALNPAAFCCWRWTSPGEVGAGQSEPSGSSINSNGCGPKCCGSSCPTLAQSKLSSNYSKAPFSSIW